MWCLWICWRLGRWFCRGICLGVWRVLRLWVMCIFLCLGRLWRLIVSLWSCLDWWIRVCLRKVGWWNLSLRILLRFSCCWLLRVISSILKRKVIDKFFFFCLWRNIFWNKRILYWFWDFRGCIEFLMFFFEFCFSVDVLVVLVRVSNMWLEYLGLVLYVW